MDVVETDALNVVHGLRSSVSCSHNALIYLDVKALLDSVNWGSCLFIPRDGNKVVHRLANVVYSLLSNMY